MKYHFKAQYTGHPLRSRVQLGQDVYDLLAPHNQIENLEVIIHPLHDTYDIEFTVEAKNTREAKRLHKRVIKEAFKHTTTKTADFKRWEE